MSSKDLFTMEGVISERLPNLQFRVKLSNDHIILTYLKGILKKKLRRQTSLLVGDKVKVELSTYDLDRGRITARLTK